MEEKRRINSELELAVSLRLLAQAHEEIATLKIRLARGSVLATREYLSSLSEVFYNIKSVYKNHLLTQQKKEEEKGKELITPTRKTNGKTVFVLLSANDKMYGDIIPKVFNYFIERLKTETADIVIVGKIGKELFEGLESKKPFTFFQIPDTDAKIKDMEALASFILQYENITIFYGKFTNMVVQNPTSSNISGQRPFEEEETPTKEFDFIFEPSIEEILQYFEKQIYFLLFNQTIHEAELTRYASRIKTMEYALEHVNARIDVLETLHRRARNLLNNKKQQNRIAGMSLWLMNK